jgi:hypothetical protein
MEQLHQVGLSTTQECTLANIVEANAACREKPKNKGRAAGTERRTDGLLAPWNARL